MCGVFGIVSNQEVGWKIARGLYDLQHRGEQAAGIAVSNAEVVSAHAEQGLVTEIFTELFEDKKSASTIRGHLGIGHTLYSTIGEFGAIRQPRTLQPLLGRTRQGRDVALAHNGNLVRLDEEKRLAEERGYQFKSSVSDTEVILAMLVTSPADDIVEALRLILPRIESKGAFSLVILTKDKVIGVRDKFGVRPLCLGRDDNSLMLASESCAFSTQGAQFIREIQPGEIIVLGEHGIEQNFIWAQNPQLKIDILEFIYFARPDSKIAGRSVYSYRMNAGRILAREHPVAADVVIAIPKSGEIYDIAFAEALGIPVRKGIYRNRYFARRTFLASRETNRRALQRIKLHPLREVVHEKSVAATDDSIFRGNVTPEVVAMLREAGAREVHLRIGSAPIRYPDYVGIDIPSRTELVAASLSVEEVRKYIQADSLGYLSLSGMIEATGLPRENLYLGCFTGEYLFETPGESL